MATTHLLIDGDVVAFIAASAVQKTIEDENGIVTPMAERVEGEIAVENILAKLTHGINPDAAKHGSLKVTVLLSDKANWRYDVDAGYKANRADSIRPLLLDVLKNYLRDKHGAYSLPCLEADDAIGILATAPNPEGEDRIICGRDKDFMSIPGRHHQINTPSYLDPKGRPLVKEVTTASADRWHMVQTLSGDLVDGYPGCPGIGPKRAELAVTECMKLIPEEGVITRGPNKGRKTIKWRAEPTDDLWECIVSHYEKAKLGEMEALTTARLARILRWGEYDFDTNEVKLWTPPAQSTS